MRLLERQASLIEHLTAAETIYGEADASVPAALRGIDPALLRIEARFSHDKRMDKIAAVFPRTMKLLASRRQRIVRRFTRACPPTDISRIENARQFHAFLLAQARHDRALPRHLCDVASLEFACARLRALDGAASGLDPPQPRGIRRRSDVILLRCTFDIRSLIENAETIPIERDTPLALGLDANSGQVRICELAADLFDLLAALDRWVDPDELGTSAEIATLVCELVAAGLVEERH